MTKPTQSKMMEKLYGEKIAAVVYARCQELGEDFNVRVQEYVYDTIWAKPGIALKEKSIITIVALILANKAEQLKIHLWGLFHQGCTPEDVETILNYLIEKNYISKTEHASKILKDSAREYFQMTQSEFSQLSTIDIKNQTREKNIIDFAAHIVIGDIPKTENCAKILLENNKISIDDMKHIMQHIAVYCGFPVEMNGLMVLNKIMS